MNTLFGIKGDIEERGYSNAFFTLQREIMFQDNWVLRDKAGAFIDTDAYRVPLTYRNNLELKEI